MKNVRLKGKKLLDGLFIAQGFNGIEVGRAHGREHAASDTDQSKNRRGDEQGLGRNEQCYVSGRGMLRQRAVEGQSSY